MVIQDSFARGTQPSELNGSTSSDTQFTWAVLAGNGVLQTFSGPYVGTVTTPAAGSARASANLGQLDMYAQIKIGNLFDFYNNKACICFSGTDESFLAVNAAPSGGFNIGILQSVAGAITILVTPEGPAFTTNDVLKITYNSSTKTLTKYLNGSPHGATPSYTFPGALPYTLGQFAGISIQNNANQVQAFEAGTITTATLGMDEDFLIYNIVTRW